ncbi:amidohydrolase family protein [Microbulbifer agarilyticus]|uniref:amidohydrolase family protein n=1 Tax=Microbulbifer agarilyticus TaxID=260552 RepID=UPI001C951665|nr:amidohydrolase family protein [Microbulbifer agarilyticus]MBY6192057.1 amidohydrolase family protein [Microbulbifer agarilyticus]
MRTLTTCLFLLALFGCSKPADEVGSTKENKTEETFSVMFGGTTVGDMAVVRTGNQLQIDFGFSNNGRGASSQETLVLGEGSVPTEWKITGKTTFGNAVDEEYVRTESTARWRSASGEGQADVTANPIYIAQNASPYSLFLYTQAVLESGRDSYPALPAGDLVVTPKRELQLKGESKELSATMYAVGGIDMDPQYLVLDEQQELIAIVSPRAAFIRQGLEGEEKRLRELAASLNAARFEEIASRVTHQYQQPVRVNNVRVFDPKALGLTQPVSVLVKEGVIVAIDDVQTEQNPGEVTIDGEGGALVAGLYEMHGHMSDNDALLNVIAGVTSVRDMGNESDVLESLIEKIDSGQLIGPRIIKSGFIEGVSEYSNSTGELAPTKEDALQLVRDYAAKDGYMQIKIYSSMNGEWIPDIAKEAHKLGLRVAGHIPAFYTADQMIEAGYNEITHINQLMLGWVLTPEEDTRTLFRITGMKRFVDLDLTSDKVAKTLEMMVANDIALDPTTVIHELGMTSRNGITRQGALDYIENMPVSVQRRAKVAMLNVADDAEDQAYKAAYQKIIDTLALMHQKGILLVPGTDFGGAFEQHRELELFQEFGMSAAEALKRGTYDMAEYLGHADTLGSIEVGKQADFFLVPGDPTQDLKAIKTISMVTTNGKFFYPTEVYPEFGVKPFTRVPVVKEASL